jgi:hypothetical protein
MIVSKRVLNPSKARYDSRPARLTEHAIDFWGGPTLRQETVHALRDYAHSAAIDAATASWEREQYPVITENALRALVVASPDYQAC